MLPTVIEAGANDKRTVSFCLNVELLIRIVNRHNLHLTFRMPP